MAPLVMAVISILFTIVSPDGSWSRLIGIVLMTAAILLTLEAADMVKPRRHVAAALMIIAAGLSSYGTTTGSYEVRGVGNAIAALPILFAALMVLRWITRQARIQVNMQAVVGGVLVYLLIGMMFGWIYGAVTDLGPAMQFFCSQPTSTTSDRLYFSFSTITTTGFGDFVPCTQLGHTLAVTEAVFGQIYLVTIIALLVGSIGGRARTKSEIAADEAADESEAQSD